MESLTLEQASYLAEIIGVVAVVVSLVYVALQVKQNTRAVRLNTVHMVTEDWRDTTAVITGNGDLAEILTRAFADASSVSGGDKLRYYVFMHNFIKMFENAYYQHGDGALDEHYWSGIKKWFINLTDVPGVNSYWQERKNVYAEEFQHFMDSEIIKIPAEDGYKFPGTE